MIESHCWFNCILFLLYFPIFAPYYHQLCPLHNLRLLATDDSSTTQTIRVTEDTISLSKRLDLFLTAHYPERSRSFLSQLCENGCVVVNNKTQNKNFRLNIGDEINVMLVDEKYDSEVTPENIPLDILYEDEHIIAINKPAGMVVHPAVGSPNGTFVNALLYHLGPNATKLLTISDASTSSNSHLQFQSDLPETPEAASASPPSLRPGIVHRLDKGTSGVLLAAKHSEAVSKLSNLFALRRIKKIYVAICIGHPGDTTIVESIGRSTKNRQLMTVYDGPPGRPAVTHVRTLSFDGKLSTSLVRIETGRTHQIRVHLKFRRTPIAGDTAYGNGDWNKRLQKSDRIHRPLLHAYEIEFVHPFTQEVLNIKAPIPSDMLNLIQKISYPNVPIVTEDGEGLLKDSSFVKRDDIQIGYDGDEDEVDYDEVDYEAMAEDGAGMEVDMTNEGRSENKGFVPMDRLFWEEEDDFSSELPESLEDMAKRS